jgi:hypothetical protein
MERTIVVRRSLESVGAFLEDPRNLVKWDRSVARVVPSEGLMGLGYTFDTIGPSSRAEGKRSCYRIVEFQPNRLGRAELVNPGPFKSATWLMRVESAAEGTTVTCGIELAFSWRSLVLAPVLWLSRGALMRDLVFLKQAIESEAA